MKRIPLPPYGLKILKILRAKQLPTNDIFLFVGDGAWESAKIHSQSQAVLLLPQGESPYNYLWPVEGCSVLTIIKSEVDSHIIKQLAHVVLSSGATVMRAILPNFSLVVYR